MKKGLRILRHILVVAAAVFIMLGLPFLTSDYFAAMAGGSDAVSSASVIMDAPSGDYLIFMNKKLHTDEDTLKDWDSFFQGHDEIIFDDIACSVATGDSGGQTMAESYQSRLPENQMKIQSEASVMLLSRLENDEYDVIVMSKEFSDSYGAEKSVTDNALVIHVKGAADEKS